MNKNLLKSALAAAGDPKTAAPTKRDRPYSVAIQDRRKKNTPPAPAKDVHLVCEFAQSTMEALEADMFPFADTTTMNRLAQQGKLAFVLVGEISALIDYDKDKLMFKLAGVERPDIVSVTVRTGVGKLAWRFTIVEDRKTPGKVFLRVS